MKRLLPLMLFGACVDLPWGTGGTEVSPVGKAAMTRVLGHDELTLGAQRLASALGEKFGHQVALEGLSLPLSPGYEVALQELTASLGPVTLLFDAAAGLLVKVELSVGEQEFSGLPEACTAKIALAPGSIVFALDLASDKLGRILPVPRGGPRWEGQDPHLEITGCPLAGLLVPDLAERLAQAAKNSLEEPLIQALPQALGLDLAFSNSRIVGLDALGAGIIRASLRAAEEPALRTDTGLAIRFDLGLDADAHPCGMFSRVPDTEPAPPPEIAGTSLSMSALERIIRVAWVAGSVCGASSWTTIPEQYRELPLDEFAPWPGLSELLALEPAATASASFWPDELPRITADNEFEDVIRVDITDLEADITAVLDGARWRLFTLELDLVIRGQIAADADGFVHFDPLDIEATVTGTSTGLGPAPETTIARTIIEPIVRTLLESRPLMRLPPSLTPSRTVVWRVDPSHTTLPGATL